MTRGGTTIPHATVNRVVDELQQHGSIRRPLLGVGVYPVEEGLLVMSVKDESGAANAGIRVGDIIRTIGAEEVRSPRKLHAILMNGAVGNEIEVELLRGGEKRNVRVAVGAA